MSNAITTTTDLVIALSTRAANAENEVLSLREEVERLRDALTEAEADLRSARSFHEGVAESRARIVAMYLTPSEGVRAIVRETNGNVIEGVKHYRALYNAPLREAMDAIRG